MSLRHFAELYDSGKLTGLGVCLPAAVDAVSKKNVPLSAYRSYSKQYQELKGRTDIPDKDYERILMGVCVHVGVENFFDIKFHYAGNVEEFEGLIWAKAKSGERVVLILQNGGVPHAIGARYFSYLGDSGEWMTVGMPPTYQDLTLRQIYRKELKPRGNDRGNIMILPPEK